MKPLKDKELKALLQAKVNLHDPAVPDGAWDEIAQRLPKGQSNGRWRTAAAAIAVAALAFLWYEISSELQTSEADTTATGRVEPPRAKPGNQAMDTPKAQADAKQTPSPPVIKALAATNDRSKASLTKLAPGTVSIHQTPELSLMKRSQLLPKEEEATPSLSSMIGAIDDGSVALTATRKFTIKPKFVTVEAQLFYHTLEPSRDDENLLQGAASSAPFSHRLSFSTQVGYETTLSFAKFQYGLGLDWLSSEMHFSIANVTDGAEQIIRNQRLTLGVWSSILLSLQPIRIPGNLEGGISAKYAVWSSDQEAFAYDPLLWQYHARYGLSVGDRTWVFLGYASLLKSQNLGELGSLRPHIYSMGMKRYLR